MKRVFIYIMCLTALASCTDDSGKEPVGAEDYSDGVYVATSKRQAAEGIEPDSDGFIIIDSFDSQSILYFTQMGASKDPKFINNTTGDPYLYRYQYYQNDQADWNTDYNFKRLPNYEPFKWNTVTEIGSYGNAFHFYAMYFPVDNTPKFYVQSDQRGPEEDPYDTSNFAQSDIMGAYHATSALFTRMRFNLFHLMVYLKVTLYVPVVETTQNDAGQSNYSGFDDGAVQGAYLLGALTDFGIEWRANRSSDVSAPLTQSTGSKKTIYMYAHEREEGADPITLDVRDFYTGTVIKENELVREYNFSVLVPNQTFGDNFLCFALKDIDNQMKYYYFSGSQVVGDKSNYALSQGTLQELKLYLPRTNNQTILVQARILPWNDALTEMTVSKQTGNGNE